MRVLGIDFGTSNTVAILRMNDGRVKPLLFDGSPMLPSAVYLSPDGKMLVGRDAERNARVDPARYEPNPKRRIDDTTIFLGDQELPVTKVFATVLQQILHEARRQLGGPPEAVRMTHPARWGERRRNLLIEGARLAGLPKPQLIPEPVGAASYFTSVLGTAVPVGRSLAIYDLGGGTFDATVVRRTRAGFEVLSEEGLSDVGGLDFDHGIVEHMGKTYAVSHADTWARLMSPRDDKDRRYRRMLYEDVRGAKEMLSRTASADIHLPAMDVDAHLTREEFEGIGRPLLERTIECMERAIRGAKQNPQDLVGIFLVGGSSRIPAAASLIHTGLGVAPRTFEQPETVVVEGALSIGAPGGGHPTGPPAGPPRQAPAAPQRPPMRPPMSGGPTPVSPRPPAMQPQQPQPQQPQPPMAPRPQHQPQSPPPRPPMQAPVPHQTPAVPPKKASQEPAVVVTVIIAAVLVIAFVVLLITAISG